MLKTTTSIIDAGQISGVLPIANGGTGNTTGTSTAVKSNATNGILQIAGPAAAATRTMTVPDANFTAARTDAANSFTADQTLATGNLVQGTAAKGVNFTANTPAAGMTSQLLNWYEEGNWTPIDSSGASLTLTIISATYTRVGRQVNCFIWLTYPSTVSGATTQISGLPFNPSNTNTGMGVSCYNSAGFQLFARATGTGAFVFVKNDNTTVTNADISGSLFGLQYTFTV